MKKILIIASCNYPNKDANAVRQHTLAKLFNISGYETEVFILKDCNSELKEYEYVNYRYVKPCDLQNSINNAYLDDNLYAILLNDIGNVKLFKKIKEYAIAKDIILLHDAVEWYSKRQFTSGFLSRTYWRKEYLNRILIDNNFRVISISKYFERYFKKKNITTIRIPVIMDITEISPVHIEHNKMNIVYIGSPGTKKYNKDCVYQIFKGFNSLPMEMKNKVELNVVGIEKKEIEKKNMTNNIIFWGRLSREKALAVYQKADFSILLRPDARYTRAGFPTKIVESLTNGVPVITNITSDLSMYLKDGNNSIIIKERTAQNVREAIISAIYLNDGEKSRMKKKSRNTAEEFFDYKLYRERMMAFLRR